MYTFSVSSQTLNSLIRRENIWKNYLRIVYVFLYTKILTKKNFMEFLRDENMYMYAYDARDFTSDFLVDKLIIFGIFSSKEFVKNKYFFGNVFNRKTN